MTWENGGLKRGGRTFRKKRFSQVNFSEKVSDDQNVSGNLLLRNVHIHPQQIPLSLLKELVGNW